MTGVASMPTTASVAPTTPLDMANRMHMMMAPTATPPGKRCVHEWIVSNRPSAIPDRCSIAPMKTNSGSAARMWRAGDFLDAVCEHDDDGVAEPGPAENQRDRHQGEGDRHADEDGKQQDREHPQCEGGHAAGSSVWPSAVRSVRTASAKTCRQNRPKPTVTIARTGQTTGFQTDSPDTSPIR